MIIPECDCAKPMSPKMKLLILVLALLVLGAGLFTAVRFIKTRPKPPAPSGGHCAPGRNDQGHGG